MLIFMQLYPYNLSFYSSFMWIGMGNLGRSTFFPRWNGTTGSSSAWRISREHEICLTLSKNQSKCLHYLLRLANRINTLLAMSLVCCPSDVLPFSITMCGLEMEDLLNQKVSNLTIICNTDILALWQTWIYYLPMPRFWSRIKWLKQSSTD